MSKLGKILLYVATAGALADVGAAFMSYQKFGEYRAQIDQTNQALAATRSDLATTKKALEVQTQATADANSALKDTQAKLDDLNTKLAADEKTLADTNTALAAAKDAEKALEDKLQALTTALGGKSPEELNAQVKKVLDDLAATKSEVQIMQDQLKASQDKIAELKKDINSKSIGYIPPGVSGKVTFVNRAWNFVVLNVGLSNGVVPNGELIVYRGRDFLGKVKVTSVESNSCVADILPDAKADIQAGDNVLN